MATHTVRIAGELSHYIVDTARRTVHQIKTNRRTGRQFATNITHTDKAGAVWQIAWDEDNADRADARI